MSQSYILNKREVVMKRHERQESDRHVYFQLKEDGNEYREGYYMTRINYEDMGEPNQITVTVVPGNQITVTVVPGNQLADEMCPDIVETGSHS